MKYSNFTDTLNFVSFIYIVRLLHQDLINRNDHIRYIINKYLS